MLGRSIGRHLSLVAAGIRYGRVKLWDADSWQEQSNEKAHDGDDCSAAFSPNGRRPYTRDGDWDGPSQFKVWNIATRQFEAVLELPGEVLSLALSPDGKTFACGGRDGRISVHDMRQ